MRLMEHIFKTWEKSRVGNEKNATQPSAESFRLCNTVG